MIENRTLDRAKRIIRRLDLALEATHMPTNPEIGITVTNDWGPKGGREKADDLTTLCARFPESRYDIRYGSDSAFGVHTAHICTR